MEYHKLGGTDIDVSVIAMGCWAMGSDPVFWGLVDDNESIAAIHQAMDLGVTLIDTAAAYGCGHSERIVGKAIAGRRDQVVVATKCGVVWKEVGDEKTRCLKKDSVLRECEASLRRLRVDAIDLYQLHWPDTDTPIAETMEAMMTLREQGRIRAIGVSNFSCQQMTEARQYGPVACLQPKLSMLDRSALDDLVPYCQEYAMGVIAYSPLASGLLSGKYDDTSTFTGFRANHPDFTGERFHRHLQTVERLKGLAARLECTIRQLALRWVIGQPGVTAAIAGAKLASQVRENAAAAVLDIPDDAAKEIEQILSGQDAER